MKKHFAGFLSKTITYHRKNIEIKGKDIKEVMRVMINKIDFGVTKDGETASRFRLENSKGMCIEVSDFGALVLSVFVPDKQGEIRDVVLGYENIEDYYKNPMGLGAYIGRNANRIVGAKVTIEDKEYVLDANLNGDNLHSGFDRSHYKFYHTECGENEEGIYVEFSRISPHMEQGFPGNLKQKIRYMLTEKSEFIIDYEMVSDKTTVVNPTNHSYFNLDGHKSGAILGHEMEIYSDQVLEMDEQMHPTGEIRSVTSTPMDFQNRKQIGKNMDSDYRPLKITGGYDHNYVFPDDRKLRKVAKLYGEYSGITMEVFSDLCGLQVYSGNHVGGQKGKEGVVYVGKGGICFETQFYPNACNEPKFPSCILPAGEMFQSRTIYQFGVE